MINIIKQIFNFYNEDGKEKKTNSNTSNIVKKRLTECVTQQHEDELEKNIHKKFKKITASQLLSVPEFHTMINSTLFDKYIIQHYLNNYRTKSNSDSFKEPIEPNIFNDINNIVQELVNTQINYLTDVQENLENKLSEQGWNISKYSEKSNIYYPSNNLKNMTAFFTFELISKYNPNKLFSVAFIAEINTQNMTIQSLNIK